MPKDLVVSGIFRNFAAEINNNKHYIKMKKLFNEPTMGIVELKKTDVVSTSGEASAPSATRADYGTANVGAGTIQEWD